MKNLSWGGFGLRVSFALLLVFATYNPAGLSIVNWLYDVISGPDPFTPWLALAVIALIIGWAIYIRATLRSLGTIGITLAAILIAILIWIPIHLGWIDLSDQGVLTWMIEIFIALLLGVGMSWSHIRRRLSGQVDVDDIEE